MESEAPKGKARRLQIVMAATRCFEQSGFHGTSMAQISEAAGMSVGHIYHYFAGKESLIAAIVEVKLDELFQRMNRAAENGSLLEALVAPAGDCEDDGNDSRRRERALWLEMLAEGERNPKIAELLHKADARVVDRQREIFLQLQPSTSGLSSDELDARLQVFNALLNGLPIRALFNPHHDSEALDGLVHRVLHWLIEP